MLANGLDHDGGFLGVPLLEQSKMALINARLDGVGQELLEQIGGAKIVVALDAANGTADRLRQEAETDAGAGGKGLGIGACIDHAVGVFPDCQRGRFVISFEAQFAVGGIFQKIKRMACLFFVKAQQFQCGCFLVATRRDATGILKIADEVEELYFPNLAASGEGVQGSLKGGEVQAIRFHGNAAALHAMASQNTEVNKVGGVLEEND